MKNICDFIDLQKFRYHVRLCHNESGDSRQLGESNTEPEMQFTYQDIIARRKGELLDTKEALSAADTRVFRNNLSSLHSYLAFVGKTDDSSVGREMLHGFNEKLASYLDALNVTPRTKSDRRSHLRAWQRTVEAVTQSATDKVGEVTVVRPLAGTFHQILREAVANSGVAPKTLAKLVHSSPAAIQRWLKGAYPNPQAIPSVHRLEAELGLERDTLLRRLPDTSQEGARPSISIGFRERQRVNTRSFYRLKEADISASLNAEWNAYFEYKTSRGPVLERSTKGVWQMLPMEKISATIPACARRGNQGCVTASIAMGKVRGYLGFLSHPETKGGFGKLPEEAQTLAWLVVPSAIEAFLNFLKDRSGGLVHSGHATFCSIGASMVHPVTGYLTQQPEFANKLPEGTLQENWTKACSRAHRLYRQWKQDANDISRKPNEPIQQLLNLSEPLGPIIRAVARIDQLAAESAPGSVEEALHKRDALLLSMLMANPLRVRNFTLMTWREHGNGSLYCREDGQWRLRFEAKDFKNMKYAKQSDYDAPLPAALNERIEEYLVEYRPRLTKDAPDCKVVFPTQHGNIWKGLGAHFQKLTSRHVPETPGFGPHAMRHLVATDWLRKHPNDFLTAAMLLHDKLETVLRNYAHLRQDDAFTRFEAHLEAVSRATKS
ncbi:MULTISPECIES: site-specific integrase [Paraburkholderia]|uniref:site-specific integrase n=1 Tax=Paraburkholderia TaxID=1822464 RepID=UPI0003737125|nr:MULTISPECIES: site-specific integrase [Paraburkholderia]MDH6149556.1 integrase/ribosome-binding protein aMBF1 (putative translation factor) [Paraburkholderia sp. WSM4179]